MTPTSPTPDTVTAVWQRAARDFAALPAFQEKAGGRWASHSYADTDRLARELAAGLVGLGVGAGDRVCILASTGYPWITADIAVALAGAASVPIYTSVLAEGCQYIARDAGARVAIVEDAAQLEKLLPLCAGPAPLHLVYLRADATLDKPDPQGRTQVRLDEVLTAARAAGQAVETHVRSMEALRATGRARLEDAAARAELDARAAAVKPEDIFTIIYTSGTTGQPKGVVLSHACFHAGIASGLRALTIEAKDHQYLFLPLAHVLAREVVWAPVLVGAVTAFSEGLTKIKDNLLEVRPTFMAGVPRIFEKFYTGVKAGMAQGSPIKRALVGWAMGVGRAESQARRAGRAGGGLAARLADKLVFSKLRAKLGLDRCRFLISGGAPLAPEIAEFFHAAGLLILEGYGLTETVAAAFVNRLDRYRFGTVGPAIDVIEVKIAEDGEILLRGPSVFKEYFNNPAATAEAFDEGGWFKTGDIGVLEDGFLRITDRKKDLIVTAGGKNIAPQPIENALKAAGRHVGQAMVVGDKKPYCVAIVTVSEVVVAEHGGDYARAAADPGVRAAIQAAVDQVNKGLASYESIKAFAIAPADFTEQTGELTPSLKVKRKVILGKYGDLIEGLYAAGARE